MKKSTDDYWDNIHRIAELLQSADCFLLGVGAGMSASGGLNYTDPALVQKWYPHYFGQGKRSIFEILTDFWPNTISEKNAALFWGFWANHINHIRYEPIALQPYLDLYNIVKDREYFICTTNVDGQLEKAGFEKSRIYAPQGDYAFFQCAKPCSQDIYNNKEMIITMLENTVSPFEICSDDIPYCPKCDYFLIPNLRCDETFVETPHLINAEPYKIFIQNSYNKKIVLLELGVGFNTPVIIRYPFEVITSKYPNTTLVRINLTDVDVSDIIKEKSICIQDDIGKILSDILSTAA